MTKPNRPRSSILAKGGNRLDGARLCEFLPTLDSGMRRQAVGLERSSTSRRGLAAT